MLQSTPNLCIEVSMGEAIDKLNILELKRVKITEPIKIIDIHKEIDTLSVCIPTKTQYFFFYNLLTYVNEQIWDMTDVIKKTAITDPSFSYISNQIFEFNQKRFRLKTFFNVFTNSNLKEQKSYSSNTRYIQMNSIDTIYRKIAEINYLSIEYDVLVFDLEYQPIMETIFKQPNIIYDASYMNIGNNKNIIVLDHFQIDADILRIFELPTINYIGGGLLGDFIHSLSVINEKFLEAGRKARLFLADDFGSENFTFGLENTYNDIFEVVSKQIYIDKFLLYPSNESEKIDINLNIWRGHPLLWRGSFYTIYKDTYDIHLGKHKWLDVSYNDKWKDTVFINVSSNRFPMNVDYNRIFNVYKDSLVFISNNVSHYEYFINQTNLNIIHYNPVDFTDLCVAINSCKLFIGNLSSPLSIAHALEKKRYMCLKCTDDGDTNHVLDMHTYVKNIHSLEDLHP